VIPGISRSLGRKGTLFVAGRLSHPAWVPQLM
jgi:hypothetical protein